MSQSVLSLRTYCKEDLESLIELDSLCFDEVFRFSRLAMRRFAEARNASTTIAEFAGHLVGFAIVQNERVGGQKIAYLTTLDVHPKFRRRGVARKLLKHAFRIALHQDCAAMHLHVFRANSGAVAFYEREGFVRQATVVNFYGQHLDAYFYQKPLRRDELLSARGLGIAKAS